MNGRWLSMIIGVFFALALFASFLGMRRVELQTRDGVRVVLTGVLRAARQSVDDWSKRTQDEMLVLARSASVRNEIENVLKEDTAGARRRIDQTLSPLIHSHGFLSYLVLGLDGTGIVGGSGLMRKSKNWDQIGASTKDLPRLRSGPAIRLPFRLNDHVFMAASAPIIDGHGRAIAIIAVLMDPVQDFSRAFRTAWSGDQISCYAFDRSGRIISDIDLHGELIREGLIRPGESTILSVDLRDPGGDLSTDFRSPMPKQARFTQMAEHALSGGSGLDLDGYRDYRGREVVGAWEWDSNFGMGIAAEVGARQAYAAYATTRRMMFGMLGFLLAASLAVIFYLWKQSRELYRAVDTLRTTERTLNDDIELRNEFISVASHEIRTPLTPIRMELNLVGKLARAGTLGSFPMQKIIFMNDISSREIQEFKKSFRITWMFHGSPVDIFRWPLRSLIYRNLLKGFASDFQSCGLPKVEPFGCLRRVLFEAIGIVIAWSKF